MAERYIAAFQEDMAALGVPAQIEPKATDHIPQSYHPPPGQGICLPGRPGRLFPGAALPGLRKLSGQSLEDMQAGARIARLDPHKEDPLDFVLWKGSKPGEPTWDSPGGPGATGVAHRMLRHEHVLPGESFDLHGGGQDLALPITKRSVAQGQPFARYWIHGLLTINQEKMSKSLGISSRSKRCWGAFPVEVVRFFLISSHYRSSTSHRRPGGS